MVSFGNPGKGNQRRVGQPELVAHVFAGALVMLAHRPGGEVGIAATDGCGNRFVIVPFFVFKIHRSCSAGFRVYQQPYGTRRRARLGNPLCALLDEEVATTAG